jgi:hypothetical protein
MNQQKTKVKKWTMPEPGDMPAFGKYSDVPTPN